MKARLRLVFVFALVAAEIVAVNGFMHAQTLSGSSLVAALRQGGYVVVLRHASSPREGAE